MFQAIKRAKFLSKHNYPHWATGDIVSMHLWLQEHGWPANEFVDLYMRGHRASPPGFEEHDAQTFKFYMEDQYMFVQNDNVKSLNHLFETISLPEFMAADKVGLVNWLGRFVEAVKSRTDTKVFSQPVPAPQPSSSYSKPTASPPQIVSCPKSEQKIVNPTGEIPRLCRGDSSGVFRKKWRYDSTTKILKNNITGMAYLPNQYEYQRTSNVSGFQIMHGPDVWVNDFDIDRQDAS